MNLFILDDNSEITINKIEILLVPEFAALWQPIRNKSARDKNGYLRLRAFNEFKYIYLAYDWESPYKTQNEQDRQLSALEETGLTPDDLKDTKLQDAIKKYQKMQVTPQMRLLESAYRAVDELTLFYNTVDLQERDEYNKHIVDSKKIVDSLGNLSKTVAGLESLELVVKRQKEANAKQVRGDVELGILD